MRDIDIAVLSVRLSVRLSFPHVPIFYRNDSTYCHSFFATRYPYHSSVMNVKHLREIPTGSPPVRGGALNAGAV